METKFNSQICTSLEQSKTLLALGLKKETADMYYRFYNENTYEINPTWDTNWEDRSDYKKILPAWSLARLVKMATESPQEYYMIWVPNAYDDIISDIESLIKEGDFNKEYLVDQEAIEEHCKGVLEYLDYIRMED